MAAPPSETDGVREIKVGITATCLLPLDVPGAFRALFEPLVGIAAELSASNTSLPAGYDKPIEAADKRGSTPITHGAFHLR